MKRAVTSTRDESIYTGPNPVIPSAPQMTERQITEFPPDSMRQETLPPKYSFLFNPNNRLTNNNH